MFSIMRKAFMFRISCCVMKLTSVLRDWRIDVITEKSSKKKPTNNSKSNDCLIRFKWKKRQFELFVYSFARRKIETLPKGDFVYRLKTQTIIILNIRCTIQSNISGWTDQINEDEIRALILLAAVEFPRKAVSLVV